MAGSLVVVRPVSMRPMKRRSKPLAAWTTEMSYQLPVASVGCLCVRVRVPVCVLLPCVPAAPREGRRRGGEKRREGKKKGDCLGG
jgi:hypothetical protein